MTSTLNISEKLDNGRPRIYIVSGMRMFTPDEDSSPSITVDILGAFHDPEEAIMCYQAHMDMDTTLMFEPTITSMEPDNFGSSEILLKLSFINNVLHIQSQLVNPEVEARIIETEEVFEALIEPKDLPVFIERARMWFGDMVGGEFTVSDQVPDIVLSMIETY